MTLADLPHELILHIANQIGSEKDILAFAAEPVFLQHSDRLPLLA